MEIDAVIESPKGTRNKYRIDLDGHRIWLDRTLFTATQFPADYGFVPDTISDDGHDLDVLVLMEEPTFPGCWIRVRPVGVLLLEDERGGDPKVLCVPAGDPRWEVVRDVNDVAAYFLDEVAHFFRVYKQIEPDKLTECHGWRGRADAEALVERTRRRFADRADWVE